MTIAFGAQGADGSGTTSVLVGYPAGITAGQMLLLYVTSKYPPNAPATPAGWTFGCQYTGGSGASAVDAGFVYITVYYRIADGTETGDVTVSIASGNVIGGRIGRYTGHGAGWDIAFTGGPSDTPASVSWQATGAALLDIKGEDFVVAASAINSDAQTFTAELVTATGVVFGTMAERHDLGWATGDDVALLISDHPVTSGVATAAPVYTATASSTLTDRPAGATAFVRLRETGVTYGGIGARGSGQTTSSPACPTIVNAGDLLVLFAENKYPPATPTTPSGWTLWGQYAGGSGASGSDSGQV